MKKKEIVLTLGFLAEKDACDRGIEEFKRWYPNGHATLSEVLRKLQELASTARNPLKYVNYAKWLVNNYPPTQETLVLNELTEKVIIHNGNIDIKSSIDGERFIIGNGKLNIKGDVNLTRYAEILAETVKAKNIWAYSNAGITAVTIDAKNITADAKAVIWANGTIKAINIETKDYAQIRAYEINTINIAAYSDAGIWAKKINTQNIMDDDGKRIRGDINLIQPSSNPQNVTQPAN